MRVLFLDDDPQRQKTFSRLSVGHSVDHVYTAADAIAALSHGRYDLACLDHDLGGRTFVDSDEEETGYQVAKAIEALPAEQRPASVIVHSFNPVGTERMVNRLEAAGVPVVARPFGTWHLLGD